MSQNKTHKIVDTINNARKLHETGKTYQAIKLLESHPDINTSASGLALLGHYAYIIRNFEAARVSAEKALGIKPDNRLALHTMGELAMKSRDLDSAASYFQEIVSQGSKSHLPYSRLADIYINRKAYHSAIEVLNHGLESHSGNSDLQDKLLFSLTMAGRVTEAGRLRTRMVQNRNPDSADMSLLLNRFEKLEPARLIEQLKILAGFETYQNESLLFERLAQHLMNQKRADEAIPYLERLIMLQPRNDHARLRLAEAQAISGQWKKAEALLSEMEKYRDDFKLKFVKLQILIAAKQQQKAINKCVELLKLEPRNKRLRKILLDLKRAGVRPKN